jgi:hypothetical protein
MLWTLNKTLDLLGPSDFVLIFYVLLLLKLHLMDSRCLQKEFIEELPSQNGGFLIDDIRI